MIEECRQFFLKYLSVASLEDDTHVRKILENIIILFNDMGMLNSIATDVPVDGDNNSIPWYTYPVIDYLNQLDFSRCSVLEFGSGYSTLFWSNNAFKVLSIERDESWFAKISEKIDKDNAEILLASETNEYNDLLETVEHERYDIIIIDGRDRYFTMTKVLGIVKRGGILIFDNSDWYPESCSYLRKQDFTQIDFCGFGPINNYRWCTSIFFKDSITIPRKEGHCFVGRRDVVKADDRILD